MLKRGLTLALLIAGAVVAQTATVSGKWEGTMTSGGKNQRITFHLRERGKVLTGTVDRPDQGISGIPLEGGSVKAGLVRLGSTQLGGYFVGKLSSNNAAMDGKWKQGNWKPLTLKRGQVTGEGLLGSWKGTLPGGEKGRQMIFYFTKEDGALAGKVDSVGYGGKNIPFSAIKLVGKKLFARSKILGAEFNATLGKDPNTLQGHWWEGFELPLKLQRR